MNSCLFSLAIIASVVTFSKAKARTHRKCGPLFLTVQADTKTMIIMNWKFTCANPPDTLILCASSFKNGCPNVLATVNPNKSKNGTYKTKIPFGYYPKFPGGWNADDRDSKNGSHCFPYWIVSLKNGKKVDENCLKIEPTWMERFGKLRIGSMMIPGTHNSGSWKGIWGAKNWYTNQDRNFWAQLVSGIRFFDIRVGYHSLRKNHFWLHHDVIPVTALEPELQHVLTFLKKTQKEIVILNFHRFPMPRNFSKEYHIKLLALLWKLFAEFILPPIKKHKMGRTLEEIWKTGKRLIISYNECSQVKNVTWLWNSVVRKWGNKKTITDMYKYLKHEKNCKPNNPMCVLMAEPTPATLWYNLRSLADNFNPQLNYWMRNEKWNEEVNIVAVDYFMSSDIVDIAIEGNKKRLANVTGAARSKHIVHKHQKTLLMNNY